MAVKYIGNSTKKFICLSTDDKPDVSSVPIGSELFEADTKITYLNTGDEWIEQIKIGMYS